MTELEIDNDRIVDVSKDPITEEFVFEFKEKVKGTEQKYETQVIQRVPVRIIANWSKLMYHDLDEKIFDDKTSDF